MNLDFGQKLGLHIWKINVKASKIDGLVLEIFEIMIADFYVEDQVGNPKFFQKIFLGVNIQLKVILGMFFSKISNVDVSFGEKTSTWKSYTTNEALSTTKRV